MAGDPLLGAVVRLGVSLDALAALAAHVRVETEGLDADLDTRRLLAEIAGELGTPGPVDATAAAAALGMVRALLRQAVDTVENPGRRGGWTAADDVLLQNMGRQSMSIVDAVDAAGRSLDGLAARLATAGSSLLDVGTGSAWLAIALARRHPELRVVGIDVFDHALALAAANVAGAGLGDRVEVRHQDVITLDDDGCHDVVWLPLPFLPAEIVPAAIAAAARALRPGGWLLAGTFAGPDERLAGMLVDLRTVRSGGRPWRGPDIHQVLTDHGLLDAHEVPRTWAAPVRLHVGRRGDG